MSNHLVKRVMCCKGGCNEFYELEWDGHVPDDWCVLAKGDSDYPICPDCAESILADGSHA